MLMTSPLLVTLPRDLTVGDHGFIAEHTDGNIGRFCLQRRIKRDFVLVRSSPGSHGVCDWTKR
jgi:hypothetical protein